MNLRTVLDAARSRTGRVLIAGVGLAALTLMLHRVGPGNVWASVRRLAVVMPVVVVLEGGFIAFEAATLWRLYGADRHRLPFVEIVRSAFIAYATMCLVPAGRAVAEGYRATAFARFTNGARAAAAAARFQIVQLVAQTLVSGPCAYAAWRLGGPRAVPIALIANGVITGALGLGVHFAARKLRIGAWLAGRMERASEMGPAFDALVRDEPIPPVALGFAFCARLMQVAQYSLLIMASGGAFGLLHGLCGEGLHLVGATLGELVPGQLGATDATFAFDASALGLAVSSAMAIPLVVHGVQVLGSMTGLIVAAVWRPLDATAPSALSAARAPESEGSS